MLDENMGKLSKVKNKTKKKEKKKERKKERKKEVFLYVLKILC